MKMSYKILIGLGIIVFFAVVVFLSAGNNFIPASLINPQINNIAIEQYSNQSGSWFVAPADAKEIVEMRTSNSKTWFLGSQPDGSAKYMWQGRVGDVHYKNNPDDPNESWKDINNNIVVSDREGYDYQMIDAGYKIYLKENFGEGKIVRYEKWGEWLEMEPGPLKWALRETPRNTTLNYAEQLISEPRDVISSPLKENPNEIYWPNAYGGKIDFKLIVKPTRLIKILGVENFNHLPPLTPELAKNPDNVLLELNLGFEFSDNITMEQLGNEAINFKNAGGEILWQFMKPKFWDSGEPEKVGTSEFIIKNNELRIKHGESGEETLIHNSSFIILSIRVPYAWLKQAVFPVYIDPTATLNVATSADDGLIYEPDTFNGTFTSLDCGAFSSPTLHNNSVARFLSVNIPQGSTINSAYITYTARSVSTNNDIQLKIAVGDEDSATQITSYNAFVGTATTTGIDWDMTGWASGTSNNSPDISVPVQTVINRAGWASGNAINIFCFNDAGAGVTNRQLIASWDHTSSWATEPVLTITWLTRPPGMGPAGGGFLMF